MLKTLQKFGYFKNYSYLCNAFRTQYSLSSIDRTLIHHHFKRWQKIRDDAAKASAETKIRSISRDKN